MIKMARVKRKIGVILWWVIGYGWTTRGGWISCYPTSDGLGRRKVDIFSIQKTYDRNTRWHFYCLIIGKFRFSIGPRRKKVIIP